MVFLRSRYGLVFWIGHAQLYLLNRRLPRAKAALSPLYPEELEYAC